MQRTGTTSVGAFFKAVNFNVADWPTSFAQQWSYSWYNGDFERIFNDPLFKNNQVFEDDPWWLPEFYKVLYHRFPNAKFILFTRDPQAWVKSMVSHSKGKTLGNTLRHAKVYRREAEFYEQIGGAGLAAYNHNERDNLMSLKGKEKHYAALYERRNFEVEEFFKLHSPESLFTADLNDTEKWQKLANFMGLKVPVDFAVHENKSNAN